MNVNFNGNFNNHQTNPAFGAIHISENASRILKESLSQEMIYDLSKIVERFNRNKSVDVYVSSEISKELLHAVAHPSVDVGGHIRKNLSFIPKPLFKSYNQVRYFESPIKFLSRVCKKAEKLKNEVDKQIAKLKKI